MELMEINSSKYYDVDFQAWGPEVVGHIQFVIYFNVYNL